MGSLKNLFKKKKEKKNDEAKEKEEKSVDQVTNQDKEPAPAENQDHKDDNKPAPKLNMLTKSKAFQKLVESTFASMDEAGKGEIEKDEMYAGLLMIHLKLAKFVGAAACFPPTKQTCDELFEEADHDESGTIDKEEFVEIMGVCCAQILSRVLIYYLIIVLLVPFVASEVVIFLDKNVTNMTELAEKACESAVSFILFSLAVPLLWNKIDDISKERLARTKAEARKMKND